MGSLTFKFDTGFFPLLSVEHRCETFVTSFKDTPTLKHMLEALGVPHTEVGEVYINGVRGDLSHLMRDGEQIEVFLPQPGGPEVPRFVVDNHLGRLASALRMFGFDTLYRNDYADDELAVISVLEDRILLTRDHRLLMRKIIQRGYWVRSQVPAEQTLEIFRRFDLAGRSQPFRRCLRCNDLLLPVSKMDILDQLKPMTKIYYTVFHRCPQCGQLYWKGSHYERMQERINAIVANQKQSPEDGLPLRLD